MKLRSLTLISVCIMASLALYSCHTGIDAPVSGNTAENIPMIGGNVGSTTPENTPPAGSTSLANCAAR